MAWAAPWARWGSVGWQASPTRAREPWTQVLFIGLGVWFCGMWGREGRVGCCFFLEEKGDGGKGVLREWLVDAQFPFAHLAVGHELQHPLHPWAEIREDVQHIRLGPLCRVRSARRGGEVGVGLHGRQVVDCVVGHRVRDDVSLLAYPARHRLRVHEGEELLVVAHLLACQHDAVGGLVRILDLGADAEFFEHFDARFGLYAVGREDDVAGDGVRGAGAGDGCEGGFGVEVGDEFGGCGHDELDGRIFFAAGFEGAGEGCTVAYHVWVAVGCSDVV